MRRRCVRDRVMRVHDNSLLTPYCNTGSVASFAVLAGCLICAALKSKLLMFLTQIRISGSRSGWNSRPGHAIYSVSR